MGIWFSWPQLRTETVDRANAAQSFQPVPHIDQQAVAAG